MLSLRLKTIESMVDPGKVVADIGTDHALLPVELVKSGKVDKVYAVDNKSGPYLRAMQYIKEQGCQDKITAILADGLTAVSDDADCWVIAGMGYDTAALILSQPTSIRQGQQLIVQVNHGVERMRRYLCDHGWQITDERIIFEAHYYQIIKAAKMKSVIRLKNEDISFGPILRNEKSPIFVQYWESEAEKLQRIVERLDRKNKRAQELQKQISSIVNMLNG